MAKEVTRTLVISHIKCVMIGADADGKYFTQEVTIDVSGKLKDEASAKRELAKRGYDGAKVVSVTSEDVLWAISEDDFIKYGHAGKRSPSQQKKS